MVRVVDTLVERLQERVRSTPIPVTWTLTLHQEMETLLWSQLETVITSPETPELVSVAHMVNSEHGKICN